MCASSGSSAFVFPLPRDENQAGAADVFQTVDAGTLTAPPLSSVLLHFKSSQWHKSTLIHTFAHQQLNGAHALQTNFYSSIGSNLLLLKRSGEWEGRSLLYLNHHPQKKTYFHRSTGLLFNIIINSYISNHYIKKVEKKSHNNHHFAQQTWSIKHFKLTHMTFCCMSRAQNSLELGVETSERRDIKITEGRLRPKTVWSQIGQRAIGWTWCTNPDGTEVPALMVKDIT